MAERSLSIRLAVVDDGKVTPQKNHFSRTQEPARREMRLIEAQQDQEIERAATPPRESFIPDAGVKKWQIAARRRR